MKMCIECRGPVPNGKGEYMEGTAAVRHKQPPGCPIVSKDQPDHRGKLHDSVRRQLYAADMLAFIKVDCTHLKQLLEAAELGSDDAAFAIGALQRHVEELHDVISCQRRVRLASTRGRSEG